MNQQTSLKKNDTITAFIESFNPAVSHYRIDHAPNRRYLPSYLSQSALYDLFCQKQKQLSLAVCSRSHFVNIFSTLNISFCSPTVDKCSICENHNQANHNCELAECTFIRHKESSRQARENMKNDSNIASASNGKICCVSVDMQKVIQIPKLTIKDAFFSRKLNVFNETFAPVHSKGVPVLCFMA